MYNTLSAFGNTAAGREQALKSIIDQATRELNTIIASQNTVSAIRPFPIPSYTVTSPYVPVTSGT